MPHGAANPGGLSHSPCGVDAGLAWPTFWIWFLMSPPLWKPKPDTYFHSLSLVTAWLHTTNLRRERERVKEVKRHLATWVLCLLAGFPSFKADAGSRRVMNSQLVYVFWELLPGSQLCCLPHCEQKQSHSLSKDEVCLAVVDSVHDYTRLGSDPKHPWVKLDVIWNVVNRGSVKWISHWINSNINFNVFTFIFFKKKRCF